MRITQPSDYKAQALLTKAEAKLLNQNMNNIQNKSTNQVTLNIPS